MDFGVVGKSDVLAPHNLRREKYVLPKCCYGFCCQHLKSTLLQIDNLHTNLVEMQKLFKNVDEQKKKYDSPSTLYMRVKELEKLVYENEKDPGKVQTYWTDIKAVFASVNGYITFTH